MFERDFQVNIEWQCTDINAFFWDLLYLLPAINSHKGLWNREKHMRNAKKVFHNFAKNYLK